MHYACWRDYRVVSAGRARLWTDSSPPHVAPPVPLKLLAGRSFNAGKTHAGGRGARALGRGLDAGRGTGAVPSNYARSPRENRTQSIEAEVAAVRWQCRPHRCWGLWEKRSRFMGRKPGLFLDRVLYGNVFRISK